jgi:GNAT superfamily N-acetyltransferase
MIRECRADEHATMLDIINAAAMAYKGVIPDDCWHEPYMSRSELQEAIAAGVKFSGYEKDGVLVGVMGIQPVRDVYLIRHAYVRPDHQGAGIGKELLVHLQRLSDRRVLVGTWTDATWAIRFYERHGFVLQPRQRIEELLRTYWDVSDRQIETSVVLELQ